jgi:hypothetical protein
MEIKGMRNFIKGMLAGAALTASGLVGYAYGVSRDHQSDDSDVAEAALTAVIADKAESSNCEVKVGVGRTTLSPQCQGNQVMVGRRSEYILCADISVSCPVE